MKDLIILGRGKSWKDCPFDAECWATSTVLEMPEISNYRQINKVFAFDDYTATKNGIRTAKKYHIPVVSTEKYATEVYSLKEIEAEFGYTYFKPTASYMIALAVLRGYERLRLYGIDQGPEWEHLVNKPFVMHWLGVATGRGIKWELSHYSILLETMGEFLQQYIQDIKNKAKIARNYIEDNC